MLLLFLFLTLLFAFGGLAIAHSHPVGFDFDDFDEQLCATDVAFKGALKQRIGDAIAIVAKNLFACPVKLGDATYSRAFGLG